MYILVPKKHQGKSFPQICSLWKLSSSVVSGRPNRDCNDKTYLLHSPLNKKWFLRETMYILEPKKPPGEKIPQICSLYKS